MFLNGTMAEKTSLNNKEETMGKLMIAIIIGISAIASSGGTKAISPPVLPCSIVLEPLHNQNENLKGTALLYNVKSSPSSPRTSISIHALHLPVPGALGNYDSYEGFVFIPNQISWRFRLYRSGEKQDLTWAGKIEEISTDLKGAQIQVRPANSRAERLGPPVLTNHINACK